MFLLSFLYMNIITRVGIVCQIIMNPKFQKRSELKLDGGIIPKAQRSGIMNPKFQKRSELKLDERNETQNSDEN